MHCCSGFSAGFRPPFIKEVDILWELIDRGMATMCNVVVGVVAVNRWFAVHLCSLLIGSRAEGLLSDVAPTARSAHAVALANSFYRAWVYSGC